MERRPTSLLTTLAISVLAFTLIAPWVLGQDPDRIAGIRHRTGQGDVDAQFSLDTIYSIAQIMFSNGMHVGPESDAAEAAKWYRLTAEQDHATAQNNLAGMYADGRGRAAGRIRPAAIGGGRVRLRGVDPDGHPGGAAGERAGVRRGAPRGPLELIGLVI